MQKEPGSILIISSLKDEVAGGVKDLYLWPGDLLPVWIVSTYLDRLMVWVNTRQFHVFMCNLITWAVPNRSTPDKPLLIWNWKSNQEQKKGTCNREKGMLEAKSEETNKRILSETKCKSSSVAFIISAFWLDEKWVESFISLANDNLKTASRHQFRAFTTISLGLTANPRQSWLSSTY